MVRYLAARLGSMLLVLLAISVGLFGLSQAAPGGPLGSMIPLDQVGDSQALIEAKTKEFGLDKPLPTQYYLWMSHLLQGDLGTSFKYNRPVAELIAERMVPTLELMGLGLVIGNAIAIGLGLIQAAKKGKPVDYVLGAASLVLLSTPAFFLGMLAIFVFSATLGWLPSSQMSTAGDGSPIDLLRHLVLPVAVLAAVQSAGTTRFVRAGLLEELNKDYIRTAIAKGATRGQARWRAFRNALGPISTIMMMGVPGLLSGAVVLEAVFAWPGMGSLTIDAISARDYPIILGFGMLVSIVVVLSNLAADLLLSFLDPRVALK